MAPAWAFSSGGGGSAPIRPSGEHAERGEARPASGRPIGLGAGGGFDRDAGIGVGGSDGVEWELKAAAGAPRVRSDFAEKVPQPVALVLFDVAERQTDASHRPFACAQGGLTIKPVTRFYISVIVITQKLAMVVSFSTRTNL